METLIYVLSIFSFISRRLSLCAQVGFIAGILCGLGIANAAWAIRGFSFTNESAFINAVILAAFAWIVLIFTLCIHTKFIFTSVALPVLVNCLMTSLLTVFVSKWLNLYSFAWLIGMFVGFLVGTFLCRLNSIINKG